jgi:hypothetical protein
LDPVVASKVKFTNNNTEMEEYVPRSNIIKELGGEEDWEYKYIEAVPGENDTMKDTATRDKLLLERETEIKEYEKHTLEWIHSTPIDAAAVSTIKERRHSLANTLRDGYWVLDPYVRAKSFYDRSGMLALGGQSHFYWSREAAPAKEAAPEITPAAVPTTNGTATKPIETSSEDLD